MSIPVIEEHYAVHHDKLVKRLAWRAGSVAAAEDIVQEAYYRAIKYFKSFNGDEFNAWFHTILNNCLREHQRVERGYSTIEVDEEEESYECPAYLRHVMKDVFKLIRTKSDVQQEVLFLYFKQEYTAKNISEITKYTYSQCHQIIQRFKNELRGMYHA